MNIEGQGFHTNPERINRNGRPKKYTTDLKAFGYSQSQINDCIKVMLSLTEAELNQCLEDPNATILEKSIAKALERDMNRGSLESLEVLLNRSYGKALNTTRIQGIEPVTIVFSPLKEVE